MAVSSSFTVAYLSQKGMFSTAFLIAAAVGFVIVLFLKAPKLKKA